MLALLGLGDAGEGTGGEAGGVLLGGVRHIHQQLNTGAAGGGGSWRESHGGGNAEGSVPRGGQVLVRAS